MTPRESAAAVLRGLAEKLRDTEAAERGDYSKEHIIANQAARVGFDEACTPESVIALCDAADRVAELEAALTEIAGHGCVRASTTTGPLQDAYDHLSACVSLACDALARP